jgi:hypothetical protein
LTVFEGDNQVGNVGSALSGPITLILKNGEGEIIDDEIVDFVVTKGGGTVTGAAPESDPYGYVTLGSWVLGAAGENTLTAQARGGTGLGLTITATGISPTEHALFIAQGNNQSVPAGSAVAVTPSVRVTLGGSPVAGVEVNFFVAGGQGTVAPASRITGADGIAAVDQWVLGSVGANLLLAELAGPPHTSVMFAATGTAPAPIVVPFAITCSSGGQTCAPRFSHTITTATGVLSAEVTVAPNCSFLGIEFFIDGVARGNPQTVAPSATSTLLGVQQLGPVTPGQHLVELQATGSVGGCNAGSVASWGGSVTLRTN